MKNADPKVFIRAIKRLKCCRCCCYAIDEHYSERCQDGELRTTEMEFFHSLLRPPNQREALRWSRWWDKDDLGVRVIALQLAACVAKDKS